MNGLRLSAKPNLPHQMTSFTQTLERKMRRRKDQIAAMRTAVKVVCVCECVKCMGKNF